MTLFRAHYCQSRRVFDEKIACLRMTADRIQGMLQVFLIKGTNEGSLIYMTKLITAFYLNARFKVIFEIKSLSLHLRIVQKEVLQSNF